MKRKNEKGFTLVEVIVVAVIVAVLAAVAIPLYIGYINDANMNSATNCAGAAASFLAAGRNCQTNSAMPTNFSAGAQWNINTPTGQVVNYTIPDGVTLNVSGSWAAGGTVNATKGNRTTNNIAW
jgi:type IV pilus assembly protein PilA